MSLREKVKTIEIECNGLKHEIYHNTFDYGDVKEAVNELRYSIQCRIDHCIKFGGNLDVTELTDTLEEFEEIFGDFEK